MASVTRELASFKLFELKEILKSKGVSTKGSKAELLSRLIEIDPHGAWLHASINDEANTTMSTTRDRADDENVSDRNDLIQQATTDEASQHAEQEEVRAMTHQREIELYRREKELAEKELRLVQRELELLRTTQREMPRVDTTPSSSGRGDRATGDVMDVSANTPRAKVNVTAVADLLSEFNGRAEDYETWDRQVRFLRTAYDLDDNLTKILIGTKLKGRALDWFHSKPDYIAMTSNELLAGLRSMFCHRPNKIALRRRFEERTWMKGESFHDYVHEKVIMANKITVDEDEILGYIIDGIPDMNLRDLARVQGFTTREEMLQAFEEIRLEDRRQPILSTTPRIHDEKRKYGKSVKDSKNEKKTASDKKENVSTRRCYNCGERKITLA